MIRYFISDLHLSDKRPDLIRAFVLMCKELEALKQASQLYILGDFYEAWIGDDYQADWNTQIEDALASLSESGTPLFFMHGNRDFLIGERWLERVGATLLHEQSTLECEDINILLTHGDEYCLEDTEYQAFRKTVRSDAWQKQILSLPLEQRIALAAQLRNDSKTMASEKSLDIMDVTESAVLSSLSLHNCRSLIHGHTHRPALHTEDSVLRCVLGDWDKNIWLAIIQNGTFIQSKASVDEFLSNGLSSLKEIHHVGLI